MLSLATVWMWNMELWQPQLSQGCQVQQNIYSPNNILNVFQSMTSLPQFFKKIVSLWQLFRTFVDKFCFKKQFSVFLESIVNYIFLLWKS